MKINWKEKLSSRKFWTALAAWITSLLTAFHVTDSVTAQVTIILSGIGALAVYILAEAHVDGKRAGADTIVVDLLEMAEKDEDWR